MQREIARIKMPIGMTAFGKILTVFSEEYPNAYAKQEGEFIFIYVDD